MPEEKDRGFVINLLEALFTWFKTDLKATLFVVIFLLGWKIMDNQEKMYERLITELKLEVKKEVAPIKSQQDSTGAKIDTTTSRVLDLINQIERKLK